MSARQRVLPRGVHSGGGQRGHSLVEVMVSIVILSIAIIPMVTMFDTGLTLATRAGNLDRARAFAGEKLALVETLSYGEARDTFPTSGSAPGGGAYESSSIPTPGSARLPHGATYVVAKEYVAVSPDDPGASSAMLTGTGTDEGLLKVTVTVRWSGGSHSSSRVVARGET